MAEQQPMVQGPKRTGSKIKDRIYPYLSILPVLIVIALFAIYPIIHAVRMSFYRLSHAQAITLLLDYELY